MYMSYQQSTILHTTTPLLPLPALNQASMAMQHLFNVMLFSMALLLLSPPSKRLAKANIWILIIADFTHWAGLFWTMASVDRRGWAAVLDTTSWSPDVWQLVTYPLGTLAVKFATLAGVFGEIRG